MPKCKLRGCGRPVRFVPHERTGRRMILDPEPSERGNVLLVERDGETFAHVLSKGEAPPDDQPRYLDHHGTCPSYVRRRR